MGDVRKRPQPLTDVQGMALVALARNTLMAHFGETSESLDDGSLQERLRDSRLKEKGAIFVTLKIGNSLRGCIGSLSATASILAGVKENALHAAFHDPRFPPLQKKELDAVHIEVSVLSEPIPMSYTDADALLAKLQPGVDGVIIEKGTARATFLPQVWEQLPTPESFLSNLCVKAGLPANAWQTDTLTVQTYQVQYFEETG